jgi:hypothetical protein
MLDLAQMSHFLFPSFLDEQHAVVDAHETVINEGARRLFLRILRFSGKEGAIWQLLGEHAMSTPEEPPGSPSREKGEPHGNDL